MEGNGGGGGEVCSNVARDMGGGGRGCREGLCTKSLQNFGIVVQADACFATAPDVKNSETRAAVHSLIGKF